MKHPQLNFLPLKRPWTAVSDGDRDPASACDSPVPATPSDRGADHAIRAAQPSGHRAIHDDAGEMTTVDFRRTRQASDRQERRAEGRSTASQPDSAVAGPSQSLDGEHRPRRAALPNQPAAAFTVSALRQRPGMR